MSRLFLTAGHNGPGSGANGYIDEGAETIALRDDIVKAIAGRVQVITDRNADKLPIVLKWLQTLVGEKDLLVEIHFNASANATTGGTETLIPDAFTTTENSIALRLNNVITRTLTTKNRGIKTEKDSAHGVLGILRQPRCHNILIEVCFVSSKTDADLYTAHRAELVRNLAGELVNICNTL